jgi:hypothetical protein
MASPFMAVPRRSRSPSDSRLIRPCIRRFSSMNTGARKRRDTSRAFAWGPSGGVPAGERSATFLNDLDQGAEDQFNSAGATALGIRALHQRKPEKLRRSFPYKTAYKTPTSAQTLSNYFNSKNRDGRNVSLRPREPHLAPPPRAPPRQRPSERGI